MNSENNVIDFSEIKSEIRWFIEKTKVNSYDKGLYHVYAVKIYQGEYPGEYCVTIGYFEDSLLSSYIEGFKYYTYLDEDLILLDYSNNFKNSYKIENANNIHQLTDKQIIWNKINKEEETIGIFAGYVCCFERGNIRKVYYEDSSKIPYDRAIFKFTSAGELIEYDSASFKKMLKGKDKN